MTPTFTFQTATPDAEAAINAEPSATPQINIIGVHYMLIAGRFFLFSHALFFALNKMSGGDTGREQRR